MIRYDWPFKDLEVGESCTIPAEQAKRAKGYVHVYASQAGKRMSWKSSWDGTITVTRLPNPTTEMYDLTAGQMEALKQVFPSRDELQRFARVVAGPHKVYGTDAGTVRFEARSKQPEPVTGSPVTM